MKRLSGSRLILSLSLSLSVAGTVGFHQVCPNPGNAVLAAETASSKGDKEVNLDEMWKDDSIKKNTEKPTKTVDTDTDFKIVMPEGGIDTTSTEETEAGEEKQESAESSKSESSLTEEKSEESPAEIPPAEKKIKPLCTTEQLKGSVFVKSGGWPGIGPFKTGEGDELVDQYKNRLQYRSEGNQVREAQLKLVNRGTGTKAGVDNLLSVQMAADFFLEALGARSSKIADFNSVLEEKQEFITDQETKSDKLTLNAGTYEVSIEKDGSGSDGELTISVKNTAVYEVAKVPETTEAKGTSSDEPDSNPVNNELSEGRNESKSDTGDDTSDLSPNPNGVKPKSTSVSSSGSDSVLDRPITYGANDDDDDADEDDNKLIAVKPGGDLQQGSEEKDLLKRQFTNLINTWQLIKRRAVKNRQRENLTRILGGKALATQSQAIKFLLDKHRYYEMTPGTMTVESYKAITPDKKYEVVAKINERRRYIDADTLSVLKDENTSYTVSYVVEQIRGQWLITDSKVVN